MNRYLKWVLVLVSAFIFAGCTQMELSIRFNALDGLGKGDPVLFQGNRAGTVTDLKYTDKGDYLVTVQVEKGFEAAFTEDTVCHIAPLPGKDRKVAVVVVQDKTGGRQLQSGDTLAGSDPPPAFPEVTAFLDTVRGRFDEFVDTLKQVPESEQYKAFEKELDELATTMKNSTQDARKEIVESIIPKIREELDRLREKLKSGADKVVPLEKKLDKLEKV